MNIRQTSFSITTALVALGTSVNAIAHPGHEPEDFLHALVHEVISPRGILALAIFGVAAGLWIYAKRNQK